MNHIKIKFFDVSKTMYKVIIIIEKKFDFFFFGILSVYQFLLNYRRRFKKKKYNYPIQEAIREECNFGNRRQLE